MSPAASRIHCERLQIGVSAVGHPHRALALVEPHLVPGQKVDPEEHGTELAEVLDVALHVLLGPVAGGVHPLQEPASVEVVAGVDDVGHLDVGPADDGHGRVRDRRPGGPQGVVVDAELEALGLQVVGPPGPVVHPVVGLAQDVAVRGDPLGVVDPTVGAHHRVAVVAEGRRHPVDVGLPHVLGYEGVREELVAVGAPVEGARSTGSEAGPVGEPALDAAARGIRRHRVSSPPAADGADRRPRQAGEYGAPTALQHLASRRHPITPPSRTLGNTVAKTARHNVSDVPLRSCRLPPGTDHGCMWSWQCGPG